VKAGRVTCLFILLIMAGVCASGYGLGSLLWNTRHLWLQPETLKWVANGCLVLAGLMVLRGLVVRPDQIRH
jgi:hypothetical protein